MKPAQRNYLFLFLLLLPINSWAEAIGDKDGYLKPVSNQQLEKQIKERLLKQIKIFNPTPYGLFSQQFSQSANPLVASFVSSASQQNEAAAIVPSGASSTNIQERGVDKSHFLSDSRQNEATVAAPSGTSSTNVQERGVDESDLIKTDGRYLYAINNPAGNYYYNYYVYGNSKPSGIRIYDTKTKSIHPKQIGTIGFAKGIQLTGMYLLPRKHQLLVMGGSYSYGMALRKISYYGDGITHIMRIDISNKRKPRLIQYIKIEGIPKATRRINNQLYLDLTSSDCLPRTYRYVTTKKPLSKEKRAQHKKEIADAIQQWKFGNTLPHYQVVGKTGIKTLNKSGEFLLNPDTQYYVTTLLSIDLTADDFKFNTLVFFGGAPDAIYVSRKALYITKNHNADSKSINGLDPHRFPKDLPLRVIHKFAFKEKGFDYRGSGAVLGSFNGWSDLNSFYLDEDRHGNLRVVTTNSNWGSKKRFSDPAANSSVVLTALAEHPKYKQLITLSRLPNQKHPKALGKSEFSNLSPWKIGVILQSVRLFNDYAYFVTLKNTHPVYYVVDMRNPYNMHVTGELVIPGYSVYFHPISKNLLLGVGYEVKEKKGNSGALYQGGLKLSLFDISNPNLLREVDKLEIGKRGTHIPYRDNHHIFTSLALRNSPITRITLPISLVTKNKNAENSFLQFEVNKQTRKIKFVGKLIPPGNKRRSFSGRSIIINDKLYYYSDGRLWASKWQ